MNKYISKILKPENLIIDSYRYNDSNQIRHTVVSVCHNSDTTKIEVTEDSIVGQLQAYNTCIKRVENMIKYNQFFDYYNHYPDKFVKDLLGLDLKWYQKLLLRRLWNVKSR